MTLFYKSHQKNISIIPDRGAILFIAQWVVRALCDSISSIVFRTFGTEMYWGLGRHLSSNGFIVAVAQGVTKIPKLREPSLIVRIWFHPVWNATLYRGFTYFISEGTQHLFTQAVYTHPSTESGIRYETSLPL